MVNFSQVEVSYSEQSRDLNWYEMEEKCKRLLCFGSKMSSKSFIGLEVEPGYRWGLGERGR